MRGTRRRSFGVRLWGPVLALSAVLSGAACGAGDATTTPTEKPVSSAARPSPDDRSAAVHASMRKLEKSFHARIGAYAVDTGTGRIAGYRADERFPSDSSFKAIMCGAILRKARTSAPGLLGRRLHWTARDVLPNSPVAGRPAAIKDGMTIARLCAAAINVSDNTAADLLLRQIGGPPAMTRYYRSLGDPAGRLDRTEPGLNDWRPGERRDTITPAYMARDLRAITLGSALVPADRARMTAWLRATRTGAARIRAGLPKSWKVGDKTGTGGVYATAGDVAVAWPPSGAPVVLAVYTNRRTKDAPLDEATMARAAAVLVRGLGRVP